MEGLPRERDPKGEEEMGWEKGGGLSVEEGQGKGERRKELGTRGLNERLRQTNDPRAIFSFKSTEICGGKATTKQS